MKVFVIFALLSVVFAAGSEVGARKAAAAGLPASRKRRCLRTVVSLLWPQVVGPVDQGVITEPTYEEVPKSLLEHRLDKIRKRAKAEEASRLAVRDFMQRNLEHFNHVDFPNVQSERFAFVDLFENVPVFAHAFPVRR